MRVHEPRGLVERDPVDEPLVEQRAQLPGERRINTRGTGYVRRP